MCRKTKNIWFSNISTINKYIHIYIIALYYDVNIGILANNDVGINIDFYSLHVCHGQGLHPTWIHPFSENNLILIISLVSRLLLPFLHFLNQFRDIKKNEMQCASNISHYY